jgi:pSer/pThr/pTyr-binding forkhead associated (FHA) protein
MSPLEFTPDSEAADFCAACGATPDRRVSLLHRPTGDRYSVDFGLPVRLVGSHADADVVLPDSIAGPRRFLFWMRVGRIGVVDLGGEGKSRGFPVLDLEDAPAASGEFELSANAPEESRRQFPPARRGWLRSDSNVWIRLRTSPVLFGRDPRCHVIFHSSKASEVHVAALRTSGGCWLVDLASRTGTFVNDRPIEFARLFPGDRVRIGRAEFEFCGTKTSSPAQVAAAPSPVRTPGGELLIALLRQMVDLQAKQAGESERIATLLAELVDAANKGTAPAAGLVAALATTKAAQRRLGVSESDRDDATDPRPSRTLPALEAAAGVPADDAEMHDWFQKQFAALEEAEPSLLERIRGMLTGR